MTESDKTGSMLKAMFGGESQVVFQAGIKGDYDTALMTKGGRKLLKEAMGAQIFLGDSGLDPNVWSWLEKFHKQYKNRGLYYVCLAVATDCRVHRLNPFALGKELPLSLTDLSLFGRFELESNARSYPAADAFGGCGEVKKIVDAEVVGDQICFSNPRHIGGWKASRLNDSFSRWGEGWPNGQEIVFRPSGLERRLGIKYVQSLARITIKDEKTVVVPFLGDYTEFSLISSVTLDKGDPMPKGRERDFIQEMLVVLAE